TKLLITGLILLGISFHCEARSRRAPELQQSLGTTHILPSAFVIPDRQVLLGTTLGIGLFNVLDLSTSLWLDLQQVFNISTKVALMGNEDYALAAHLTYLNQSVKTQVVNSSGAVVTSTVTMTSLNPGVTYSYRIMSRLVGHAGGTFVFR